MMPLRLRRYPKITRDTILLVSGLAVAFYEILWAEPFQSTVLLLAAGWTALPVAMRADEAIGKAKASPPTTDTGDLR